MSLSTKQKSTAAWRAQNKEHLKQYDASRRGTPKGRAYSSWSAMIQRCENPKFKGFASYGAKGVTVCERWHDFNLFFEDMGDRPKGTTIDRIDHSKQYEPGNCRWASRKLQDRNTTRNVWIEWKGKNQVAADWSLETGIPQGTITSRLRQGWTVERALTTPPHRSTYAELNQKLKKAEAELALLRELEIAARNCDTFDKHGNVCDVMHASRGCNCGHDDLVAVIAKLDALRGGK